ncbi:HD-GYP domain-containing protein [Vibrio harveyi]|uniref:HD domain-containing protein n=1 Tax=Vibrio harveyi TaxID=669 RepID=A0A8B3DHQ0_VIBHA|nr:HD domain-containing phosphohydrolase [Vibrio harveyi]RIW05307.1 HD domain-containing protein [Vibrio harveyi]
MHNINVDHVYSMALNHKHSNIALDLLQEMASHSPETYSHTISVCLTAYDFGEFLGFTDAQLELIFDAALVHDLGKLKTPLSILHKHGKLLPLERQIMNDHVKGTYYIVRDYLELKTACMIGGLHHERWDGNGYPFRLKGKESPFIAQVLAIVDTWDAMVSDRAYRAGMPKALAIEILSSEKHQGQFNPELVDRFLDFIQQ